MPPEVTRDALVALETGTSFRGRSYRQLTRRWDPKGRQMMTAVQNVEEYLAQLPLGSRNALEKLRKVIRGLVPQAEEVISYRIPTFKYHGMLVGYAAFKDHLSFFVMSPAVMAAHKADLKGFSVATATIHFTEDDPLPNPLIRKLVRARMRENEARSKAAAAKRR